jgi:hypothetical protein
LGIVGKGRGGMGKNALSSTSPPSRSRTGAGLTVAGWWRGGARRWPGARRRPGGGAKRRPQGQPIPPLTLVGDSPWGWLCGIGRRPAMVVGGGGAWGLGRQGGSVGAVRGEVGSRAGPFIGAGMSVRGDILSFAELQWPSMEVRKKSRRGLRPAGFSIDLVLCELTFRAGLLWPRRGDRQGSNGGRFGGDSSLSVFVCQGGGRRGSVGRCRRRGASLACCTGEPGRPVRARGVGRGGAGLGGQERARGPGAVGLEANRRKKKGEEKKEGK